MYDFYLLCHTNTIQVNISFTDHYWLYLCVVTNMLLTYGKKKKIVE